MTACLHAFYIYLVSVHYAVGLSRFLRCILMLGHSIAQKLTLNPFTVLNILKTHRWVPQQCTPGFLHPLNSKLPLCGKCYLDVPVLSN